jgi:outer membrane protein
MSSVTPAQTPATQATGPVLTLEEAIQLGVRNNPTHLQTRSARGRAGTQLRATYGNFLPSVSSSISSSFRSGGSEIVAGQQFGSASDILGTSYGVNINATYGVGTFLGPRQARAALDAAESDVRRSEQSTRATIMTQYLNVLQAQAQSMLQDTLVINAQAQVDLNRARQQVGALTTLDVRNAEVQLGRQQVAALRARTNIEIQMLILFQQMGVDKPEGVRLVTTFPVTEPSLQLPELLDMARRMNPTLNAARSRETSANVSVATARSQWIPTLSFSTRFSGYTNKMADLDPQLAQQAAGFAASRRSCFTTDSIRSGAGLSPLGNCDRFVFTDEMAQSLRSENSRYPFDFTADPFGYQISLSLPIFNNFRREQQIQDAALQRNDARYQVRATELQLTTDVTTQYRNLTTAYQTFRLNEQNQSAARQALDLAQERYRVGANTFLDVTTARSAFEQAATDLIVSIYDFHRTYAALEAAVGRPLR